MSFFKSYNLTVPPTAKIAFVGDLHLTFRVRSRKDLYFLSVLEKLEWLLSKFDYLVVLGDVFNSPSVSDYLKNYICDFLTPYKGRIFAIYGNHDTISWSLDEEVLFRTSLLTMSNFGVFTLFDTITINNRISIKCVNFTDCIPGTSLKYDIPSSHFKIFISHTYYSKDLSPVNITDPYYLTLKSFELIEPDVCILGHSHQFSVEKVVGFKSSFPLVSLPSLGRCVGVESTMYQQPIVLSFNVSTLSFSNVTVPVKPPEEVFKEPYLIKSSVSVDKLTEFDFKGFAESIKFLHQSSKMDLFSTIESVLGNHPNTPFVLDYLKSVYNRYQLGGKNGTVR